MAQSAYERFISDPKRRRLLEQERLVLQATEALAQVLEEKVISKAELSRRLEKTPAYVTQVLAGGRNMTLRTFADFLFVLGYSAKIVVQPISGARNVLSSTNFYNERIMIVPTIQRSIKQVSKSSDVYLEEEVA